MSTTLSGDAYCVLFMHACKHPSRAVNGLLLGKTSEQGVSVQKALPLFHTPLGLAPMLEAALMLVRNSPATPPCAPFCRTHDPCALFCRTPGCALSQADEHCKGQGLQIVGYYQANEMCDDLELGPFGKTIADKIRAQCKQAAVLVVRTAAHNLFPGLSSSLFHRHPPAQIDGAKMHPTEENLRLVSIPSSAPTPTLAEPAASLELLEQCLERGACSCTSSAARFFQAAHACPPSTGRRATCGGGLRRTLGRREEGLVQHRPAQLARQAHSRPGVSGAGAAPSSRGRRPTVGDAVRGRYRCHAGVHLCSLPSIDLQTHIDWTHTPSLQCHITSHHAPRDGRD